MAKVRNKASAKTLIERLVQRIVKKFDPDQIILFGSRARGEARVDSDVDLLVVVALEESAAEKALEIRQTLHHIPIPLDLVVTSPEEFAWRKDVVGTIEWPATREGKVLYARS